MPEDRWSSELPEHVTCPHCSSHDTELISAFGSVLANAQYYCNGCRTPFEHVRWEDPSPEP